MLNEARPDGPRQGRCAPVVGRRWVGGVSASPIVPALAVGATQLSTDGRANYLKVRATVCFTFLFYY